jgi:hypothetical protein
MKKVVVFEKYSWAETINGGVVLEMFAETDSKGTVSFA